MDFARFDGLAWFAGLLIPFLLVQRQLHRELQGVLLLLTRRPSLTLGLFSFLFLPGVFLHEGSHYLAARLLGVKTGRFSLTPKVLPGGTLRLGYLETARVDVVRDALIGTAPLITGSIAVAYLMLGPLGMASVEQAVSVQNWKAFAGSLAMLPYQPDFWVWFYMIFAISSTMMPSAADRRAWLPVLLGLLIAAGTVIAAGAGPWMLQNIAPWVNGGLRALAVVFGASFLVHGVLFLPIFGLRLLISRITGLEITES